MAAKMFELFKQLPLNDDKLTTDLQQAGIGEALAKFISANANDRDAVIAATDFMEQLCHAKPKLLLD